MKVLCINARCVEKHLELNKVYAVVLYSSRKKALSTINLMALKMITLVQKDLKLLMKKKSKSKFNKRK